MNSIAKGNVIDPEVRNKAFKISERAILLIADEGLQIFRSPDHPIARFYLTFLLS